MLEKQSLDEFLSNINKGKAVVISLSPQSRASLAVYFGLSPLQVSWLNSEHSFAWKTVPSFLRM